VQRRDLRHTGRASIKGGSLTAERGQVLAPADLRRARVRENAGVSERRLIRVAALSHAEWCDEFCRTHGIVGHFRAGYWFSPVRTPRYYPDAVTLLPEITVEQVLSGIDSSNGCSVKESYAGLDVAAAGFRPLFRAHWLAREPAGSRARSSRGWSVLTDHGATWRVGGSLGRVGRQGGLLQAFASRTRDDRRACWP
jgi:hypothetical protein